MVRPLICCAVLCYCELAFGQTFNKRYDPYALGHGGFAFSVEVTNSSDIVVFFNGTWEDSLYYSSKLGMILVSSDGIPLDTTMSEVPFNATYAGWSDASFKRADGSFVVGGSVRNVFDNIPRIGVFFFDGTGEPDSSFVIDMGGVTWIGRHIIETSDGNFLICGDKSGAASDGFLMKISPMGEPIWTWSGGTSGTDYATSVAEGSNGNYFMGGSTRISSSNTDFWLKAFDIDGVPLWDTTFGSPFLENVAHVKVASDGDLLVAGGYGIQAGNNKVKYIAKFESENGDLIWERSYGPGGYDGSLLSLKELPNGDLIGGGTHVLNNNYTGVLLRTTSEGDSLWMRYYYYEDSITTNGRGVFRDVEPTPDGGFVAVGSALSTPNYGQHVWVVKVDQHGCIEPGCHLINGMETQITNLHDVLRVWPNPSAGGPVNVAWELPENFKPQGGLRITVTSSDGRLVHEEQVSPLLGRGAGGEGSPERSRRVTLSPPQLSSGLYHLHLSDASRWISGAKLVVE